LHICDKSRRQLIPLFHILRNATCRKVTSRNCAPINVSRTPPPSIWPGGYLTTCKSSNPLLGLGINRGPEDPWGDPALFGSLYTSQLVLGTSASNLATNPHFAHHDASHDVYQLNISEKVSAFVDLHTLSNEHTSQLLHLTAEIMNI